MSGEGLGLMVRLTVPLHGLPLGRVQLKVTSFTPGIKKENLG
jgi:hypothetical protein